MGRCHKVPLDPTEVTGTPRGRLGSWLPVLFARPFLLPCGAGSLSSVSRGVSSGRPPLARRYLSHTELAPLRAPLIPMEHCTTRFFETCDLDHDKYIALDEWAGCFGIKESECPSKGALSSPHLPSALSAICVSILSARLFPLCLANSFLCSPCLGGPCSLRWLLVHLLSLSLPQA